MPPSRKFLKELRDLEKAVGRDGVWAAAEEAESKLPKRGRKKGPVYRIKEAVSRMRELKAAAPARSWHEISKQAGKEFNISWQTLRKEERERRATPVSTAPASSVPQTEQPAPANARRRIIGSPDLSEEQRAQLAKIYAPLVKQTEEAVAAMIGVRRHEIDLALRAQKEMAERIQQQLGAEMRANYNRIIGELVTFHDWREILKGLGIK